MTERTPLVASAASTPRWIPVAYSVQILASLLAASFTVFSLYSIPFQTELGYTAVQINAIAIIGEIGLYVPVPLIGYLVDRFKLSYVAAAGGIGYFLGYLAAAMIYTKDGHYLLMALAFAIIGTSASAVYISLLVNCGRLYPHSAFLAISAPTTAYGISSLIFSQWVSSLELRQIPLPTIFQHFALMLLIVGLVAAVIPVLCDTDRVKSHHNHAPGSGRDEEEGDFGHVHVSHITRFVRNMETWIFLLTFVLVSGPLETYLNNLGTIGLRIKPEPVIGHEVSIFSIFSTVSRLVVGASLDVVGDRLRPSRLLIGVLLVLTGCHILLAGHKFGVIPFSLSTTINGFAYGTIFTLYPILVTRIWGIDGFATYWGMFISGPAVGSLVYGVILAIDFHYFNDYGLMFAVSSVGLLVTIGLIHRLSRSWGKSRESTPARQD